MTLIIICSTPTYVGTRRVLIEILRRLETLLIKRDGISKDISLINVAIKAGINCYCLIIFLE